jgi:uncharacterized membrane protein
MVVPIVVMYLFPFLLLLVGIFMKKHFSEFPDVSAGYHLVSAVKNKETWEEANKYAGNYCIRSSLCLLILDFLIMCFYVFLKSIFSEAHWSIFILAYIFGTLAIQLVLLFVFPIHHLNKKFNSDGSSKC